MSCSFSKSLRALRYRLLSHVLWGKRKRRYKKKYRELTSTFCPQQPQIYIDISHLHNVDYETGIQRVTKNILFEGMNLANKKRETLPVYFDGHHYRCANNYIKTKINALCNEYDHIVEFKSDDILLLPEIVHNEKHHNIIKKLIREELQVRALIYDIIPVKYPQYCHQGVVDFFADYLHFLSCLNGVIAISQSTANDYREWRAANIPHADDSFLIDWFHLGADLEKGIRTTGIPADSAAVFEAMATRPSLLEVSTVEPRKGHRQTLDAFELLWAKGIEANFVIVGKPGWNMDAFFERLKSHPEYDRRLFWLQGISDEYLEKVYEASSGVIMPSETEGFGLAIIEGAHHGKPLILRDIPVFREIAGDHATYFSGLEPGPLAKCIEKWLDDFKQGRAIPSSGIKPLTWAESTLQLYERLGL